CRADNSERAFGPVAGSLATAAVRGIFPVLPKQAAESGLASCAYRFSSHEPQGKNYGEEAADNLGQAADEEKVGALQAELRTVLRDVSLRFPRAATSLPAPQPVRLELLAVRSGQAGRSVRASRLDPSRCVHERSCHL